MTLIFGGLHSEQTKPSSSFLDGSRHSPPICSLACCKDKRARIREKAPFGGAFYFVRLMLGELRVLRAKTAILEVFGQLLEEKTGFLEQIYSLPI